MNDVEKIKVEDPKQNEFISALRRGVIKQLYKEEYLSEAQYIELMKTSPRPIQ